MDKNRSLYRGVYKGECRDFAGKWVYGDHIMIRGRSYLHPRCNTTTIKGELTSNLVVHEIFPETLGVSTGLSAAKSYRGAFTVDKLIFVGDRTRLILPDGEMREFVVAQKTVARTVCSHPDFDDATAKVAITGFVFEWNGYDLFPCVDEKGRSDVANMEIIGTIYDPKKATP